MKNEKCGFIGSEDVIFTSMIYL